MRRFASDRGKDPLHDDDREATLDADGKTLTLDADGPGMTGDGSTAHYKDAITIESDDRRTMTSRVQGEDGQWTEFMKMTLRRTS